MTSQSGGWRRILTSTDIDIWPADPEDPNRLIQYAVQSQIYMEFLRGPKPTTLHVVAPFVCVCEEEPHCRRKRKADGRGNGRETVAVPCSTHNVTATSVVQLCWCRHTMRLSVVAATESRSSIYFIVPLVVLLYSVIVRQGACYHEHTDQSHHSRCYSADHYAIEF